MKTKTYNRNPVRHTMPVKKGTDAMNVVYVILKNDVEQPLGVFNTWAGAEDTMYRHITAEIKTTKEAFHAALRAYTVGKKEV